MAEESDGTNSYFKLIGVVKKALDLGTLLVADEMDAHLHPLLTKHLVSLFDSTEFNPKGAQLIFTSHSTNLLDLDFLRRDQIWFTEKDEQTAATDLFSLYDFSIRKDTKVEKGYLIGRFGAIPFIKGGLYTNKMVDMFTSESSKEVTLLCENELMRVIIDHYGEDAAVDRYDDTHFTAKIEVNPSGTFYGWIFKFKGKIKILSPKECITEMQQIAQEFI